MGISKHLNEQFLSSDGMPYEDPRLREQEWGCRHSSNRQDNLEPERDAYGHFYFRFPDGESCADVFDRISDFLNTLHRDFKKDLMADNVGIVFHGMTLRVFIMRWFHLSVEEFELLANPKNGQFFILEYNSLTDKYYLSTPLEKYPNRHHPYQFDWSKTI